MDGNHGDMARERFTDAEYAEMAKDYAENPVTADEVLAVEVNPAFLRTGRTVAEYGQMSRDVEFGKYTVSGPLEPGTESATEPPA
ncbi:hypothetical protein EV580_3157 [Mycobacterium sp. BK086]|nr:hypothetical protein EV580_3157 [Mycobacterium sp. BK086]